MKKRTFNTYGINIKYEFKTYKKIGKDYNKENSHVREKAQQKYKICNTYTEWEKHVKETINNEMINKKDFLHWLYYYRNEAEQWLELVKVAQIPLYIMFLSLIGYFGIESKLNFICLVILIVIISLGSTWRLYSAFDNLNFYKDFIKIVKKEIDGNNMD